MRFENSLQLLGPFPSFSAETIRQEISQPRTPIPVAMSGGPCHRAFIEALPEDWKNDPGVVIFSRMLYLKAGWYPLSPHYHCDWFSADDGPPVLTRMVLLGDASRTEFVLGPFELPDAPPEANQHKESQRRAALIAEGVKSGALKTWFFEPQQLIQFDNRAWHRASPARAPGWRVLIRAIKGLDDERSGGPHHAFTTARNNYIPETAEEIERHAPYRT